MINFEEWIVYFFEGTHRATIITRAQFPSRDGIEAWSHRGISSRANERGE